jgi:hypothetical protein
MDERRSTSAARTARDILDRRARSDVASSPKTFRAKVSQQLRSTAPRPPPSDNGHHQEHTGERNMERYEPPALIATYSIEALRAQAAVIMLY